MASRLVVPITGDVLVRESVEAPLRDGPLQGQPMDSAVRDRLENWMQVEGQVLGEEVSEAAHCVTASEHPRLPHTLHKETDSRP
jgi:hypothetical protein